MGSDERALLDVCHVSLNRVEVLGSQIQEAASVVPDATEHHTSCSLSKHKKFLCFHAFFVEKTKGKENHQQGAKRQSVLTLPLVKQ